MDSVHFNSLNASGKLVHFLPNFIYFIRFAALKVGQSEKCSVLYTNYPQLSNTDVQLDHPILASRRIGCRVEEILKHI